MVEGTKFKKGARFHGRVEHPRPTPCAEPGCREAGEFRAPGGGETAWRWLCLDHVRAFNARYNFFNGMSPDEIAAAQSPHPSWERGTKPFAHNATPNDFTDPHDLFGRARRPTTPAGRPLETADSKALAVLGLDAGAALKDIRRRYTELVRRYHPDRNGGDRSHEGKFAGGHPSLYAPPQSPGLRRLRRVHPVATNPLHTTALDAPDTQVSAREVFGLDIDMDHSGLFDARRARARPRSRLCVRP